MKLYYMPYINKRIKKLYVYKSLKVYENFNNGICSFDYEKSADIMNCVI